MIPNMSKREQPQRKLVKDLLSYQWIHLQSQSHKHASNKKSHAAKLNDLEAKTSELPTVVNAFQNERKKRLATQPNNEQITKKT